MEAISRRRFFQKAATLGAVVAVAPSLLMLEGCPVSQSQLAQLVAEVGTGLSGILPYIKGVNTALATQIENGFTALQSAVQAWKPGGVITDIEEAVNAFVANMALIPPLAVYQPLVALIVATVEGIITLLVPNATPPASMATVGFVEKARQKWPHPPKTAKEFKSKWNAESKALNHAELAIS